MANEQRTFLGHPLGLYVLFFTEMWERFSYYGMRGLLMLYMMNYFRWTQQDASEIYKVYTSLVYVTPILGGFLADRYLGNRLAVIIGAVLMAVGHFLMAFEAYSIFMAALILLIIGNGFFKPNMSVQVGRLYPVGDGRRDGAYTIFYMGINLGAFMAPLFCGWLADNTMGGFHSGFTLAGIGMVVGLVIYLVGQPLIREIPPDVVAATPAIVAVESSTIALTEEQASRTPAVLGSLTEYAPMTLAVLSVLLLIAAPLLWFLNSQGLGGLNFWDAVMVAAGGICLALLSFVCAGVMNGLRDRVLVILALGIFIIFFWGAFEQAGNPLNLWADQSTDRFLTQPVEPPAVVPDAPPAEDAGGQKGIVGGGLARFVSMFRLKPAPLVQDAGASESWLTKQVNPVPTPWFQSINALAIFVLAPFFAWLWVALDRRGWQPSIPLKMTLGLLMMSASMAVMIGAATRENQPSQFPLTTGALPVGMEADADGLIGIQHEGSFQPFHAGRIRFDAGQKQLAVTGVVPVTVADRMITVTAPSSYTAEVKQLIEESEKISGDTKSVTVTLSEEPTGFDMKYAGISPATAKYDPSSRQFTAFKQLAEKEEVGLLVAGGNPDSRALFHAIAIETSQFRVSPMWLFWSYILATLGELCLSPVGLSMVSKLAPAKYATMLMGVWLLTSSFGNFAAGLLGERWGTIPPVTFFLFSTVVVGIAAVVLYVIARKLTTAMHGVN